MTMTNEEIVRDYNAAADKKKQIKVLADLNVVSPSEIREVLALAGVEGVDAPRRTGRKRLKLQEPVQPEENASFRPDKSVYSTIETIITALPEDTSEYARKSAGNLVIALFRDYIERCLRIGGQHGQNKES